MTSRIAALLAFIVDVVACVVLWPRLPELVPVHWDLSGEADRFGTRLELLAIGPGLLVGLYVLLVVLRRVDPRASLPLAVDAPPSEAGSRDFVIAVVLSLLAVVHVSAMLQAVGSPLGGPVLTSLSFSAFQVLLGNAMPRVRSNFFVGVRTPWTLSSDVVWRRTHRLAGRLLVGSGLLSLVLIAVTPVWVSFPATVGLMVAALLVPAIASYVYWKGLPRPG